MRLTCADYHPPGRLCLPTLKHPPSSNARQPCISSGAAAAAAFPPAILERHRNARAANPSLIPAASGRAAHSRCHGRAGGHARCSAHQPPTPPPPPRPPQAPSYTTSPHRWTQRPPTSRGTPPHGTSPPKPQHGNIGGRGARATAATQACKEGRPAQTHPPPPTPQQCPLLLPKAKNKNIRNTTTMKNETSHKGQSGTLSAHTCACVRKIGCSEPAPAPPDTRTGRPPPDAAAAQRPGGTMGTPTGGRRDTRAMSGCGACRRRVLQTENRDKPGGIGRGECGWAE